MPRLTRTRAIAVLAAIGMAGGSLFAAGSALAVDLSIATGATGDQVNMLRRHLDLFEERTGHRVSIVTMPSSSTEQFAQYRLWLSAQNPDIDVYFTDVIWAGQIGAHFIDLTEHAAEVIGEHYESIVQSQTVDSRLVALPHATDAPALYYRTDLLEKHGKEPPATWVELEATAGEIMAAERAEGNAQMWGFVFQASAYEGLTTNVLEWVASNDGGTFVDEAGEITANNPNAAEAIDLAAGWVGTIAPPGVPGYEEEQARGVWQTGNVVFMRNWPYAYALGNGEGSPIQGLFDVVPLPKGPSGKEGAASLGGWNFGVSSYSRHPDEAIELALFLASEEIQKDRAISNAILPTLRSLYDDPDIAEAQPLIPLWRDVVEGAIPRPSAQTRAPYNEVSHSIWTATHATLSGNGDAATNLEQLERTLRRLRGRGW